MRVIPCLERNEPVAAAQPRRGSIIKSSTHRAATFRGLIHLHAGCLRLFEPGGRFGDPFLAAAAVIGTSPGNATVCVDDLHPHDDYETSMLAVLCAAGFEAAYFRGWHWHHLATHAGRPMYSGHLELLTGRMIVVEDEYQTAVWSACLVKHDDWRAKIVGARHVPNHAHREAIKAALRQRGFVEVGWERRKPDGRTYTRWYTTEARP